MRVCKAWHQACKDPYLNSVLDLESHFVPANELPRFWTPEFERRVDNMLRSVVVWSSGSLTQIRVRHCSDRSLALVAQSSKLSNGGVDEANGIKRGEWRAIRDSADTEVPESSNSFYQELSSCYRYEISDKSLATIGSRCPNMHVLKRNLMNWLDPSQHVGIVPYEYLNACPQDGDSEVAAIANCMPHLLRFELRFLKLTAKGVTLISEGCKELDYIDVQTDVFRI
ncbi:hypothetical protein SASPL_129603 [Salvia splendens]|uniref:F-box and leucine-rich repeat protein 2/20 n=1 Tax=Salvia splendens TaxID=180675 RepID=A0A8X8XDE3_SALSN|nr:hypothetical protein SASPL_129603 [Salvia splendens]